MHGTRRFCRATVCLAALATWLPAAGAEPPRDDPLLRALEQLEREAAALRDELTGRPAMSPGVVGRSLPDAPRGPTSEVVMPPADTHSDHWSFQPLARPEPPRVGQTSWPFGDIDRFVLAKLEAAGLTPGPDATAAALCRRLYFDLTGLPPTEHELAEFCRSGSYESLVDRLLESPQFGERWARHWLDVARYADSIGRSWNAPFTYAWRYRDYVIDSFNADVPYDQFIREQLAGDLLTSDDIGRRRAQLTACGFLGLGSLDLREGDGSFQLDQIDDQIDATTRAFLGLTVSCARCHDHKYDPITMRDYYALAGVFLSTDTLPGLADRNHLGSAGYVDPRRLARLPEEPRAPFGAGSSGVSGIHSMNDFQRAWSSDRNVRYTTDPNLAMSATEGRAQDCALRVRGEPYDLGPTVPRGDLRIPSLPRLPPIPTGASGRLELAHWIASRDNPLTARVMANRIWQHLFGRGLVRTVDDFGTTGEPPTHPELLNWLATKYIEEGWSTKRLIRTIVLSRNYRLSSGAIAARAAIDPDNAWYWRQNRRALELEPLRDAMLFVAGRLQVERPYGIQVSGVGGKTGNRSLLAFDAPYRTIYLPVMRSLVPDVYGTFDFPDPTQIQGLRTSTIVAPQALFFMNDRFVVDCASGAAERIRTDSRLNDAGRVRLVYLRLFSREPTPREIQAALGLLDQVRGGPQVRDVEAYRWTALVQALLSSAEFRFVH